jgi:predicted nucleic acid-binding protein
MQHLLLDTDIIIDYLRGRDQLLRDLLREQLNDTVRLYISSLTLYELYAGKMSIKQEAVVEEIIKSFKIIELDQKLLQWAGEKRRTLKKTVQVIDYFIEVTAVYNNLTLVTRNLKDHTQILDVSLYRLDN